MKEIVVISGKGGTGKTSVTASFAMLGKTDFVVADCDVDAADMHLLLDPDFNFSEDFYSGVVSEIDPRQCTLCNKCALVCRFDAVRVKDKVYSIDPISCEGCGYCARVCPEGAIANKPRLAGKWYISSIRTGAIMVHAKLGVGADNSGKLVAKVKNEARKIAKEEGKSYVLVDGSPGVGCPVVSSLSGAHFVVMVTEPTVSGLHDLKRVYELVKKFHIKAGCIINKADLNIQQTDKIKEYLKNESISLISVLPYNEEFARCITKGITVVEGGDASIKSLIESSWEKIKELTN